MKRQSFRHFAHLIFCFKLEGSLRNTYFGRHNERTVDNKGYQGANKHYFEVGYPYTFD